MGGDSDLCLPILGCFIKTNQQGHHAQIEIAKYTSQTQGCLHIVVVYTNDQHKLQKRDLQVHEALPEAETCQWDSLKVGLPSGDDGNN